MAAATQPRRSAGRVEEFASAAEVARYIAESCLSDGPVGRVGLELEAHCFDLGALGRRPSWDAIMRVVEALPALPGGGVVSVEPGGAVELSGPPAAGALAAIEAMRADRAVLHEEFCRAGLGLVLTGTDPLRPTRRINPGARYAAMEQFFIASHTAAAGAAMMTSTASVQVNLDAGPRSGWAARLRLAQALGPTMVAMAANSPLLGGAFSGWLCTRQRVWVELDSARCGPVFTTQWEDPGTAWAQYALKAPVMLVQSPEPVAVTDHVPLVEWAEGHTRPGGRAVGAADVDYHLTTLFPPVRPRGWLEIRYLDAVPDDRWPALVFTLVTLLDDPDAAALAAEAVDPVADAWDTAARVGLADRHLYRAAKRCLAIAAERAPAPLHDTMARLISSVEQGRCPGEDFADHVVQHGIAPTLAHLAQASTRADLAVAPAVGRR